MNTKKIPVNKCKASGRKAGKSNFTGIAALLAIMIIISFDSFSQQGFSPMKDQAGFTRSLAEATQKTNTIESRFTQEKSLNVISEKIITRGKFYFRKENKLRWEYTEPFSYLVIMNGDKVIIRDEKKESRFDASSNKLFAGINSIMVGSIRGTILNETGKFSAEYMESPEFYLVRLKPLTDPFKGYIARIRIYFNKTNYMVARLEIEEPSGDLTKIGFTGMKINTPVPDENFSVH